jgi:glycosyltransferase involved in cell wall biosynthesis
MNVTVLMATYNRANIFVNGVSLLERAIKSFLSQDYDKAQLIILNDCSTDDTKIVLKKYREYYPKIIIYQGIENKMPPNNWNWLWEKAMNSDLICQLHDDDELTTDSLSLRVKAFQDNQDMQVLYGGVITQNLSATDFNTIPAQLVDKDRIIKDEYINFVTLMYRPTIPFRFDPELRYYFDWLFKIRCLQECNVGYIENQVMRYTVHQGQETNKCRRENMNEPDEKLMREKLKDLYKW